MKTALTVVKAGRRSGCGEDIVPDYCGETGARSYPQRHGEIQTSKTNDVEYAVRPYLRGTKDA